MVAHFIFPGTHAPPRQNPSVTPSQGSTHHQADMSITTPSRDDATLGADQHQFSTTSAAVTLPKWDGTPIRASLFLRDIGEYAAQRSFLSLLLCDYYVSKNMIIAANADVVARVKEHFNNPIANPLPDDIQHPNLNPRVPSSDCTYNLTAEDKKLYCASPALFLCESSVHCQTLLSAITNPDVARRIRAASQGDARHVLKEIDMIRGELTSAQIAHHLSRISAYTKKGVAHLSAAAWAAWKTTYDDLVFCLPAAHALPGTYVAQDYRQAISPLGSEFCLLVDTEIKIRSANANPIATAAAIQMVAEEQELALVRRGNAMSSVDRRTEGAPPRNRDPRKLPRGKGRGGEGRGGRSGFQTRGGKPTTPYPWNDSRRLCSNYGDPRCGNGRHLDKDCPINKSGAGRTLTVHSTQDAHDTDASEDSILSLLADNSADISPDSSPRHPSGRACYVACRSEHQKLTTRPPCNTQAADTPFVYTEPTSTAADTKAQSDSAHTTAHSTERTFIALNANSDLLQGAMNKTYARGEPTKPLGNITNRMLSAPSSGPPPASHPDNKSVNLLSSDDGGSETESYSSEPDIPGSKPAASRQPYHLLQPVFEPSVHSNGTSSNNLPASRTQARTSALGKIISAHCHTAHLPGQRLPRRLRCEHF